MLLSNSKHLILWSLALLAIISGAMQQFAVVRHTRSEVDVLFALLGITLIFFWYRLDATEHNYSRSPLLDVMVIALAVFALPYYFFRSRGFRGGCRATGVFLLSAIGYTGLQYGGAYAVYYARAI